MAQGMENKKILVVDDFSAMRRIVGRLLRRVGRLDVFEADDGRHALEKLSSGVDMVIADWTMPHCSGQQMLHSMRQDSRWAKLPFVMMMTPGECAAHEAEVRNQAGYVLVKPFNAEILADVLHRAWTTGTTGGKS